MSLSDVERGMLRGFLSQRREAERAPVPEPPTFFPPAELLRDRFLALWKPLSTAGPAEVTPHEALTAVRDLLVHETVRTSPHAGGALDPFFDAPLFALTFVHTLRALGTRRLVVTAALPDGADVAEEAWRKWLGALHEFGKEDGLKLHLVGGPDEGRVELWSPGPARDVLTLYLQKGARAGDVPPADVAIVHETLEAEASAATSFRPAIVYTPSPALFSQWAQDEIVALAAASLFAKLVRTVPPRPTARARPLRILSLQEGGRKVFVLGSHGAAYAIHS